MKALVSSTTSVVLVASLLALTTTLPMVQAEKFFEYVCSNSQCTSSCTNYQYNTKTCYPTTTGDSMIVRCRDGGMAIEQTIYEGSTDCNSFSHSNTVAAGDCGEISGVPGEWMLYICGGGGLEMKSGKIAAQPSHFRKNVSAFVGPARLSVTQEMAQRAADAHASVKTTKDTMEIPKEMLLLSTQPGPAAAAKFTVVFSNAESFDLKAEECEVSERGSLVVKHAVFQKTTTKTSSLKSQSSPRPYAASIIVNHQVVARFHLKQ